MKTSPAASSATPAGLLSSKLKGPLSPVKPPLPATVVMTPVAWFTSRMRSFMESLMKTSPAASTATPSGQLSSALVAGPPSPEKPPFPLPATVVMTPVVWFTSRTRLFKASAMKRSPAASTATA